jgi:exocyst complex component 4
MAPYVAESKRNYVFGGISSVAANASIKVCFEFAALPILNFISQCCQQVPYILLQLKMYIQALAQMKSINLLGVQQICRNSIALEQVKLPNVVNYVF